MSTATGDRATRGDGLVHGEGEASLALATVSPARIMDVGMGFWPAKVLLSAVELRLFTELGSVSLTGAELQEALGLTREPTPISLTRW